MRPNQYFIKNLLKVNPVHDLMIYLTLKEGKHDEKEVQKKYTA